MLDIVKNMFKGAVCLVLMACVGYGSLLPTVALGQYGEIEFDYVNDNLLSGILKLEEIKRDINRKYKDLNNLAPEERGVCEAGNSYMDILLEKIITNPRHDYYAAILFLKTTVSDCFRTGYMTKELESSSLRKKIISQELVKRFHKRICSAMDHALRQEAQYLKNNGPLKRNISLSDPRIVKMVNYSHLMSTVSYYEYLYAYYKEKAIEEFYHDENTSHEEL